MLTLADLYLACTLSCLSAVCLPRANCDLPCQVRAATRERDMRDPFADAKLEDSYNHVA